MRLSDYRVGQQRTHFWLEWDCGTMNVRDLTIKFTAYASYIATRQWAREHSMLPVLVCVAHAHRTGEAHATCGSGQTHVSSWIDNVET